MYQPTDSGWHEVASASASGMHTNLGPTYSTGPLISVVGQIPEKNQVITYRGYRGFTYSNSESGIVKSWSLDIEGYLSTLGFTGRTSYWVLPLDINDAIVIVQDSFLVQIKNRKAAEPITLESPSSQVNTVYEKLYDSTFIRYNRITPGDTMVQLRHYDFTGKLLRDTVLTFSISINDLTTRFNSRDSSIALLCSGTRGIWLTYLDRELNLWRDTAGAILHDLHVNAEEVSVRNISGIFRNDTLLMVWEDYRHGDSIPDIYGNYWVLPKLRPRPIQIDDTPDNPANQVDTSSISITSLAPNPTRGVVAISVQSTEDMETQLSFYDFMGMSVWQSKVLPLKEGRNDFTVDTSALGLPTGNYIVTVRSGSHFERRKLIILHN
jgi:hypothetical protein